MRGITRDSLAEMVDRKIFWVFLVITAIAVLGASMSRGISVNMQSSDPMLEQAGRLQIHAIATRGLDVFIAFLTFLAVMASASAVPHMLERGRADYFLSKPISRQALLLSKLLSVWAVYGGVVIASGLLTYMAASLTHGVFEARIFLLAAMAALQLLVWLCITFSAGVWTGSTSMAVVSAFLIWIIQLILGAREGLKQIFESQVASTVIDALYYIMPKTSQMSDIGLSLALGSEVDSWMPLWSTVLFALVVLSGTLVYFRRKDY